MQDQNRQNQPSEEDAILEAAECLYHAKIQAFITGFVMAIFMIGAVHYFVLKVLV